VSRHVAIPRLLGIGIDGFDEYWCIGSIGIDGTESIDGIGIDSFGTIRY
jgi:hypothetical protein